MYYSIGNVEAPTLQDLQEGKVNADELFESIRKNIGFPPIAEREPVICAAVVRFCTEDQTPASTQPCPCEYGPKDPRSYGGKIIKSPNGETKVKLRSGEIVSLNPPRPAPSRGINNNTKLLAVVGSVAIGLYFFLK